MSGETRSPRPAPGRTAGLLVAFPAVLAPSAVLLARASGHPIVLPVLATAAVYPVMVLLLLRGRRAAAAAAVLLWTLSLSVSIIAATRREPAAMERAVLNGPPYRDEMFSFIRTGSGRESDPARFLPQHALHLVAFGLLAIATGGLAAITLGAILVGYMSFYVGSLAAVCDALPVRALLFGWPPWAILRVVAFVLIGVCLAEPLLLKAARRRSAPAAPAASRRPWYVVAGLLLLADGVLKLLFAPLWSVLLRPCLPF